MLEHLACVHRGAERVPRGRVLVVGNGFVGRLFGAVLERRGDEVFALDADPSRAGRAPNGPVDAAVLCARGGVDTALEALSPGGTLLVFADAGPIPAERVYHRELTIAGARSATPRHMRDAVEELGELTVPEPTVLPLERFDEGLALYRRRDARKVVFTPWHGRRHDDARARPPRPGRPPARGGRGAGARRRRGAPTGRRRADRRHRPEGIPARPSRSPRPLAEPVRSRGLRDRRGHWTPSRRRQLGPVRRLCAVQARA